MFENIMKFFKKFNKKEDKELNNSRDAAKERLHLVLMQDRANVSADFLELMKQEIIEVIKKYIDVDEGAIDVRLTNKENDDGTNGAPALYANIPIVNIKNEARKVDKKEEKKEEKSKKEKIEPEKAEKIDNTDKSEEIEELEKKESIEESDNKKDTENTENTEEIKEIQNERIAKVILEGKIYNQEKSDKTTKKEEKKKETSEQQEKVEDTKEELKSEN